MRRKRRTQEKADMTLCRQLAEGVGAGGSLLIQKIFEALVNNDLAVVNAEK
jgi:hypothetical protein